LFNNKLHSFVGTESHKWAANIGNLFGNAKCFGFFGNFGMIGAGRLKYVMKM
jgi:hypothetical protein